MENASKALIIAGSVLISIMVISLLVFGYNQLSDLEQTRANSDDNVKMAEYMRRFEQFSPECRNGSIGIRQSGQ